LNKILQPNKKYLLDGHFCLLKSDFSIETIPFDIYSGISPVAIAVLSEDIDLICKRLKERDNKQYDSKLLFTMQKIEKEHGGWVANKLDIPFFAIQNVVDNELKEYLHEFTCVN
jgi:adenylate kinase